MLRNKPSRPSVKKNKLEENCANSFDFSLEERNLTKFFGILRQDPFRDLALSTRMLTAMCGNVER